MPQDDVPRRYFRNDSGESFSAYRKLILRELERLDRQIDNQSEILNTIRVEMVRLAEGIEANSRQVNELIAEVKSIKIETGKLALVEERAKKNEKKIEKNEKKIDNINSNTKISGAATGAGGGAVAAALAELIKFLFGGG